MKKQCKWYHVCPIRYFTEEQLIEEKWAREFCFNNWKKCIRYQMEARNDYHPDCMLPDGSIRESLCKHI